MLDCLVLDTEDLLTQKGYDWRVIQRLHIRGLPKDAKIVAVFYEMAHQCIFVAIESQEFDEVPQFERCPVIEHEISQIYVKFPFPGEITTITSGEYRLRRSRLWRWIEPVVSWFQFTFATQSEDDVTKPEKSANQTWGD